MPENFDKKYKYKAYFTAQAKVLAQNDGVKKEALANLQNLSAVFKENVYSQIQENPDLLFIASNLLVINEVNLNDCAIAAEDILPIAHKFVNKFLNVEHSKEDVCGAICHVSYSEMGNNMPIDEELALEKSKTEKIQLVVGGYIWYLINKQLCHLIELSSSSDSNAISTSFEMLYDSYWIGIDINKDRSVLTSKIIKPNDPLFATYDKMLRVNGGKGVDENGNLVYCILKGDILPTGAGLVSNPASGVRGVLAVTDPSQIMDMDDKEDHEMDEDEMIHPEKHPEDHDMMVNINNININKESVIANIQEKNLNLEIQSTNMLKIESIEDITSKWAELSKNEAAASVITEFIIKKYGDADKRFADQLKAKEQLVATVEANRAEAEKQVADLSSAVENLNKELTELRAAQAAAEAEETFNRRMLAIEEAFDLDAEDRALLVDEVKAIESNEVFETWMAKQKKLMKEKTKMYKKEKAEAAAKATTTNVEVKTAIASVTEKTGQDISTHTETSTSSLKEQMLKAFSANTTVGGKKLK